MDRIIRTVAATALTAVLLAAGCGKKMKTVIPPDAITYDTLTNNIPSYIITYDTLTDNRDGQKYRTVTIGKQTWMAQNLNYNPSNNEGDNGSWCYNDEDSNCDKYGRLYDLNTAKTICPAGWKLPDMADWGKLERAVSSHDMIINLGETPFKTSLDTGKLLKSKNGWPDICDDDSDESCKSGNGTDRYGFSALPGGERHCIGGFNYGGKQGYWWTATAVLNTNGAYFKYMNNEDYVYEALYNGDYGFSVRCVKE